MRYLIILFLAFGFVYTIGYAQPGYAIDPDKQWVVECQNRAEQRVRNYEKGVKKVKILENSLEKTKSTDTKKVLEGSGKFSNYDDQWKDFTFKCVYDKEENEVAKVSYDVKGYSTGYNEGQYTRKGECKLWDDKKDDLDMEGNCRVVRKKSANGNEYTVTYNNGKEFRFIQQGSTYKVKMPKEWASNPGYVSDQSSKITFEWAKWKLVFKAF